MNQGFHYYRSWLLLGLLMLSAVIVLSLISIPGPSFRHADKVQHLLVWAALMGWFGNLFPRHRWWWLAGFLVLGLGIELIQSKHPMRHFDRWDLVANSTGLLVTMALLLTPLGRLLAKLDQKLFQRFNA